MPPKRARMPLENQSMTGEVVSASSCWKGKVPRTEGNRSAQTHLTIIGQIDGYRTYFLQICITRGRQVRAVIKQKQSHRFGTPFTQRLQRQI